MDAPVKRDLSFPRRFRLGSNRNYRTVYRRGKSRSNRTLVLVYLKSSGLKIGFSVSGKLGNAVTRNRVRRRMREDARLLRDRLAPGKYIFMARQPAVTASHERLTRDMVSLLEGAGLICAE